MKQDILPLVFPSTEKWPETYKRWTGQLNVKKLEGRASGLDIETTGLIPYDRETRIVSVAISPSFKVAYGVYIRKEKLTEEVKAALKQLKELIENPEIMIVGHNIKFDLNWLAVKFGFKVDCLAYDTMLAEYFLNEANKFPSLESLVEMGTGFEDLRDYKKGIDRKNIELHSEEDELLYNMKDADAPYRLRQNYNPLLKQEGLDGIMNIACQAIPVLSRMETRGILIDTEYANKQQMELYDSMIKKRVRLRELANTPFNCDAPQQLNKVLYRVFEFQPVKYTDTGKASTDYETLIRLRQEQCYTYEQIEAWECEDPDFEHRRREFLDVMIEYKKESKLNNTYYENIPEWTRFDGRVHTTFNLAATDTGRLSSSNPNLQNQKRGAGFRGIFIPTPGYIFLEGDYSQIELRIAAFLANEKKMLKYFEDGLDPHTATLSEMKGYDYQWCLDVLDDSDHKDHLWLKNLRVGIKNVNFGELYGATASRLQRELTKHGIYWTLEECEMLLQERREKYPAITKWKKVVEQHIIKYGYVKMPFGQIRRLPNASYSNGEGRRELRQGVNFVIQSTASGWLPIMGMILLDNYFQEIPELGGHILTETHDSILSEVLIKEPGIMEQTLKDVKDIMENDVKIFVKETFKVDLTVPLEFKAKYLQRWE